MAQSTPEQRCLPHVERLEDRLLPALLAGEIVPLIPPGGPVVLPEILKSAEVQLILMRAAAATASDDAIISIVDRNGRVLGVRVEGGVDAALQAAPTSLTFAVDGALALARTGAFFGNNQAPLTSRTIQFISQSTITEREVNSNPNDTDPNSTLRGPGFVAPIGLGGHFPPNIPFTPQVDLFEIEHTNRDSLRNPGPDRIKGTADDVLLTQRFNLDSAFIPPGQTLTAPESYGFVSGIFPGAQSRGIGTLPGGIPIVKNGQVVGGIGVFFPGKTGFAIEENSSLGSTYDATRPDRSLEAEFIAIAAIGGSSGFNAKVDAIGAVPALPGSFDFPAGRIDLVGITLDIVGPGGNEGVKNLLLASSQFGVGLGNPASGTDIMVDTGGDQYLDGQVVPQGWLVLPHDGVNLSATEVRQIIEDGIAEADNVRAQIRLPNDVTTKMTFAVADSTGEILGLFRMPDSTVFSIDVAVAKSRNVAYYNDAAQLQAVDQIPGVPPGAAFTSRTFRYAGLPHFPEGIDGKPPGPFSQLDDPGIDPKTGLNLGPPLPASVYQSVVAYDAFNPGTNFRATTDFRDQNGVVFFPGSSGVYKVTGGTKVLVGGFGVSGDGVDQDDVVTSGGIGVFDGPPAIRADQFFVRGVRLPYMKFPRNARG